VCGRLPPTNRPDSPRGRRSGKCNPMRSLAFYVGRTSDHRQCSGHPRMPQCAGTRPRRPFWPSPPAARLGPHEILAGADREEPVRKTGRRGDRRPHRYRSRHLGQARLNGRKNLVVGWKAVRILLRDALVADPDRELATAAFDQLGLDTGLIPNERRHTDSARAVVSNLAVPNPDVGHPRTLPYLEPLPYYHTARYRASPSSLNASVSLKALAEVGIRTRRARSLSQIPSSVGTHGLGRFTLHSRGPSKPPHQAAVW
jgi:hypothetical protein